ncbi:MAG TPA: response regulator [Nevskiaceae bacterium]|nr:response regulator [Nevskiaceae bacterium]
MSSNSPMFELDSSRRPLPSAFVVRYVFGGVIFAYISIPARMAPGLLSIGEARFACLAYLAMLGALHLLHRRRSLGRKLPRALLALEMPLLAIGIPSDFLPVMPLQMVVLAAMLDHGLRYGVRVYREAVLGGLAALGIAFTLRATLVPGGIDIAAAWILFFIVTIALSIWMQVADRESVDRALDEAHQRIGLAVESMSFGYWTNDLVGKRLLWDDNTHRVLGLQPGSFSGRYEDFFKLMSPEEGAAIDRAIRAAIRDRKPYDQEYRAVWPDGSVHFIGSRAFATYDDTGKAVRIVGVSWDNTAQRKDHEALRRAQAELLAAKTAAEAAAVAKMDFLANMSHEIRTPMNAILGMNSMMLDTTLTQRQRQIADRIRNSAESLLRVINDVLDISKSEAGKMQVEVAPLDLRQVVEGAIELVAERVQGKGLELALLYDHALPAGLKGDAGRLNQVLGNLLSNAVKFTEQGEIVIEVSPQRAADGEVIVRVAVRDTGIGIGPDGLRNLFQPFAQVEGPARRKYGGTGLGLSISKRLIELMGGEIGVDSAPGRGSTFWFTVRLERDPSVTRPIPRGLSGRHVLVVDDHEPSRRSLAADLAWWGMRVDTAADAQEAVSMLEAAAGSQPFEFAIIDQDMPEMDGIDLVREIRVRAQLAQLHIVMLQLQRNLPESAAMQGVESMLTKPVRYADLYEALRTLAGIAPEAHADAEGLRTFGVEGAQWRILIAEDDPLNQEVAVYQLSKLGLNAACVANGAEAVAAAMREPYDLIVMDCEMPEMDGYQAAAEIRKREGPDRHTWIVAMTAHVLPGYREKCLAAGMDDYVAKPATQESLQAAIERFARTRAGKAQAA